MCGIAGIFRFQGKPLAPNTPSILKKMGSQLKPRGPDDVRLFCSGHDIGFIFTRLSIIDLASGHQPFVSSANQAAMINGEIYNHQEIKANTLRDFPFQTKNDCEVIIPLFQKYGKSFMTFLNGMFAIALWDQKTKKLFLVRDRLGIKPLFFTVTKEKHIIFASEIKAILAHPDSTKEYDWEAVLEKYSKLALIDTPVTTGFKDIQALPAGSILEADLRTGHFNIKKWWELPEQLDSDPRTISQIVNEYRALLEDSVRIQLMSDVEVGISLSGGIDSVAIAAIASKYKNIDTFTVLNQSTLMNKDAFHAALAARSFQLPNYQLHFPTDNQVMNPSTFKRIVQALEMPVGAEQFYKFLLYQQIRKLKPGIKTILMGQGSDEFNGGYCNEWILSFYAAHLAEPSWDLFLNALNLKRNIGLITESVPHFLGGFPELPISMMLPYVNQNFINHLSQTKRIDAWRYYQLYHLRQLEHYNLWHEDRTTAANSLENRVPFLDHRLVEFCSQIPQKFHQMLFWNKHILREAVKDIVPPEIYYRPKVPFFFGDGEHYTFRMMYNMLMANDQEIIREALIDNKLAHGIINSDHLLTVLRDIGNDPAYGSYQMELICGFVSMGLLSLFAKEPTITINEEIITDVSFLDWVSGETFEELATINTAPQS